MPNYAYNTLHVSGDNNTVIDMMTDIRNDGPKTSVLDFNKIIPIPQELFDTVAAFGMPNKERQDKYDANVKKYGYPHWYDACIALWDTKWNASEASVESENGEATYQFTTAWSPPMNVIKVLSEKYPTLDFELTSREESGEFNFTVHVKNGVFGDEKEVSSFEEDNHDNA